MVFVIDKKKQPLTPCHPAKARKLLKEKKAVIHLIYPFTIRLKKEEIPPKRNYRLKIDYGAKTTGMAILKDNEVSFLLELTHKTNISSKLKDRASKRRNRRSKHSKFREARLNIQREKRQRKIFKRYRQCSYNNKLSRKRKNFTFKKLNDNFEKWLPPSLMARVFQTDAWIRKLSLLCPIGYISYENVKFDMQKMENAEISGVEYQHGTLFGYTIKEYLLEKYNHKCIYCQWGQEKKNKSHYNKLLVLETEHIIPRSKGGSDRIDNLALACHSCNQKRGNKPLEQFLLKNPELIKKIKASLKKPLKEAAVMNATRYFIWNLVKDRFVSESGSGARTKWNRVNSGFPKTHYYDACCVGESTPEEFIFKTDNVLLVKAEGRGVRQRMQPDAYGFPKNHKSREKKIQGFYAKSMVRGYNRKKGYIIGSVKVRQSGSFSIVFPDKKEISFSPKSCKEIQRFNGYSYKLTKRENNLKIKRNKRIILPLQPPKGQMILF